MRLLPLATLLLVGCEYQLPPCAHFVGSQDQPVEAALIATDGVSGKWVDVAAGADVPLVRPPQGGFVLFVAAKSKNLDTCNAMMTARLIDPSSGTIVAVDKRGAATSSLLINVASDDGWVRPQLTPLTAFPNLFTCPNTTAIPFESQTMTLEVDVTDDKGRMGTASGSIVPRCAFSDASTQAACICLCAPMAGQCA